MSLSKPATEVAEQYATAMEEAIYSATKAESEANRLKRKYEPDESEVRLDKILQMSDTHSMQFMRVEIFTGEYMMLTLIHNTRNNGNCPDWTFRPHLTGIVDNIEDFSKYGIYQVYVGDGAFGHDLLVTFDHKGVRIRQLGENDERAVISELPLEDFPEFALTHADDA